MKYTTTLLTIILFLLIGCNEAPKETSLEALNIKAEPIEKENWDSLKVDDGELDYRNYIDTKMLNLKQSVKTQSGSEEITYLGDMMDNAGNRLSHVMSVYSEVQAAKEIHAHSNIIFINKDRSRIKRFDVGTADELPFKLENNNLYFHYTDIETNDEKTFIDSIGAHLPKIICVAPDNCY